MSSNYDEEEEIDDTAGSDEDDGRQELKDAKNKAKEARDKYKEQHGKKPTPDGKGGQQAATQGTTSGTTGGTTTGTTATTSGTTGTTATTTGTTATTTGTTTGTAATTTGTAATTTAATTTGTAATTTAATTTAATTTAATTTAATTTAATTTAVATTAATTTAATTAGTAVAVGGAVAAQAAIPVAGWIALAIEAAILLAIGLYKMQKKFDKKMEEQGIDTKTMRKLFRIAPLMMPICLVVMVIIIICMLMQTETADRTQFMIDALTCFEENGGSGWDTSTNKCVDFYGSDILWNTKFGRYFVVNEVSPLIKKTDFAIAMFVAEYLCVEYRVFGENGVNFTMKTAMNDMANYEGYIDESDKQGVLNAMKEVLTHFLDPLGLMSKIHDFVKEGWYLFKWCKMEKKIFNNIEWGSVTIHPVSEGPLVDLFNSTVDRIALGIIDVDPEEYLKKTYYDTTQWKTGIDFNIASGYLRIPGTAIGNLFKCAVTLDQAIALTKEYIPSFIEIFATYAATGDYERADKVYDYYVSNMKKGKPLELKLVTYEKFIVDKVHRYNIQSSIVYNRTNKDGSWNSLDIGKSGFNEIKDAINDDSPWWKKIDTAIRNACVNFVNDVIQACDELIEEIKKILGFDTVIKKEYVTVVQKGAAYEYLAENYYDMKVETYQAERPEVVEEKPTCGANPRYPGSGFINLEYTTEEPVYDESGKQVGTKEVSSDNWKMAIQTKAVVKYNEDHFISQHVLIPNSSSKMIMYGENALTDGSNNRYAWIVNKIDAAEKQKQKNNPTATANQDYFTSEDVALAVDVINGYYSNTFGLIAGATAEHFDELAPINAAIVKYAEQFEGKKLAYMKSIDDTNTFLNDEWCAMFVSFVMKKAGVGVPKFYGCSSFWAKYKNYTGFYDIVVSGTKHGNFVTKDVSHRVNTYSYIKPGDILLFRWDTAKGHVARSHTGICKSVQKDAYGNVTSITVIEGNTGGGGYTNTKVSIKTYSGASLKNIVSFVDVAKVKSIGGW